MKLFPKISRSASSASQLGLRTPEFKILPSGAYTLLLSDLGKTLICNTNENKTITLPTGLPEGVLDILNHNCEITVVATSGNLESDGDILATDGTAASIYSFGDDSFGCYGRLTSI